jgi:hypothetical protein
MHRLDGSNCLIVYLPERADTYRHKSPIGQVLADVPGSACEAPPPRHHHSTQQPKRGLLTTNMSLSNLPFELLGLILVNIFPDEWRYYNRGLKVLLKLRTVCRKYLKRVF